MQKNQLIMPLRNKKIKIIKLKDSFIEKVKLINDEDTPNMYSEI
jgi:hypothetical protein